MTHTLTARPLRSTLAVVLLFLTAVTTVSGAAALWPRRTPSTT